MSKFKVGDKVVKPWMGVYPDFIYEVVAVDVQEAWTTSPLITLRKFANVNGYIFKNPKATFTMLEAHLKPAKPHIEEQIGKTIKLLERL